jgi:hypothetical protein
MGALASAAVKIEIRARGKISATLFKHKTSWAFDLQCIASFSTSHATTRNSDGRPPEIPDPS